MEFTCNGIKRIKEHGVESYLVRFGDEGSHGYICIEVFSLPEYQVGDKYEIRIERMEPV